MVGNNEKATIIQFSTMKTQSDQFVNVKIYDFMRINPTTIRAVYASPKESKLFIARDNYSEVYEISTSTQSQVIVQQIAELEPCMHILQINGILALFKPFQLMLFRNQRWQYHSFTTQLLTIRVEGQIVYSFHEKQSMSWQFDQDEFSYKYINEGNTPYHLDSEGAIVGLGKKVRISNKNAKLTVCQVINGKWIFAGDERGGLHVYDWKFLSHVKTFSEHEGPILTIKIDESTNTLYFSGSDSKICTVRLVDDEWKLGQSIRGQSHDILSLQLFGDHLISGGLTTDLCFYPLQNGEFVGDFQHKVSYTGSNRVDSEGKYVVFNRRTSFQIWQLGGNLNRTQLLVKYQMPADKFIVDCKMYRETVDQNTYLLLVITDEDTIGWKFSSQMGLVKYITIQNQYILAQLLPKHCFIGVRIDGYVQKVNCKNGKIEEITYCEVMLPTDLKILGSGLILVGSKLTKQLSTINFKSKQIIKKVNLQNTYTYVDHIQNDQLIIQYFNNPILYKFTLQNEKQQQLVKLPVNIIRFGGWLTSVMKKDNQVRPNNRKYWYGISEGKVIIVPNILKEGKKKIRTKQTERIAQVIRPKGRLLRCNLALIPYNFQRMIDELPIKPIFTKKIV